MIDKIHNIVLNGRRLKVREISETINISVGRVWHILHECLGMRKVSERWVPRLLTADHKRARVVASEQCLDMFQRNSKEFLRSCVTVDEKWIHYYTPETKNQSKMWTGPGESAPKKAKTVPSDGKVMATNFWDSHCKVWSNWRYFFQQGFIDMSRVTTVKLNTQCYSVFIDISSWKDLRLNNVYTSYNYITKMDALWKVFIARSGQFMVYIIVLPNALFGIPSANSRII